MGGVSVGGVSVGGVWCVGVVCGWCERCVSVGVVCYEVI